jgi:hypothetical protein
VIEHVAPLVLTATRDQDPVLEGGFPRGANGLAAVDHGQDRPLRIHAAVYQVIEQGLADRM